MFNENSYLVKLYVRKIQEGIMTIDDVPTLYNLKDVVMTLI